MDAEYFLLILADSALPIGSFAYSSGLESASVHDDSHGQVNDFLHHSVRSIAYSTVPFLRAAHAQPDRSALTDDTFDANTPCQVARRSSIAQGRALIKLLDKTFVKHCTDAAVVASVYAYKRAVLNSPATAYGHFGVAFGLAGRVLGLDVARVEHAFLHAHAKAVLSAAVRLGLIGPYESTDILASQELRTTIKEAMTETQHLTIDEAGQTFSVLDIYQGRHELLYSRIFSA